MNVSLTTLTFLLLVFGNASTGNASTESGVVYAQPGTRAQVGLEVETTPGLVVNRKNPPVVTLADPFEQRTSLTAEVTGELWSGDPETYFAHLDPVVWTLSVPEEAKRGAYPLMIEADFSLCDTAIGICFTDHREIAVMLHVGAAGSDETAKVFLSTPDF